MKIIFTGGGTGGHIFPITAIAREIKNGFSETSPRRGKLKLYYIGPRDEFSSVFLPGEGISVKFVLAGKIRRYKGILPWFQNIFDVLIQIPIGIIQ